MKKKYKKPTTSVENIGGFKLLEDSELLKGTLNDELIINYGGVDEDGNLDPSANRNNAWDDGLWDTL